jgi:hypothetical protein
MTSNGFLGWAQSVQSHKERKQMCIDYYKGVAPSMNFLYVEGDPG